VMGRLYECGRERGGGRTLRNGSKAHLAPGQRQPRLSFSRDIFAESIFVVRRLQLARRLAVVVGIYSPSRSAAIDSQRKNGRTDDEKIRNRTLREKNEGERASPPSSLTTLTRWLGNSELARAGERFSAEVASLFAPHVRSQHNTASHEKLSLSLFRGRVRRAFLLARPLATRGWGAPALTTRSSSYTRRRSRERARSSAQMHSAYERWVIVFPSRKTLLPGESQVEVLGMGPRRRQTRTPTIPVSKGEMGNPHSQ